MMKAVAVINMEMPENCKCCRFRQVIHYNSANDYDEWCGARLKIIEGYNRDKMAINVNCPLRPIPDYDETMNGNLVDKIKTENEHLAFIIGSQAGWNNCLDSILEGENDD